MVSFSHRDPDRPPKDFTGWKASDYEADPRAKELRELCILAIRTLRDHQSADASGRDKLDADLEHLQGRFIALGISPGMHFDKWTYYPTESPLAMAECRASELSRYCGVGMPSQQVFMINLADESIITGENQQPVAALPPTPEIAEFAASQMFLTICTDQLDANREVWGE